MFLTRNEIIPGGYYKTLWEDTKSFKYLHVLNIVEDIVEYEYVSPNNLKTYHSYDRIGIFLLYVSEVSSESDWICSLIAR